jgi:hypothetical protein
MSWSHWFDLTVNEVANEAPTTCGVFCVARKPTASAVSYPAATSAIVFIGRAADRQRGLRAVLGDLAGASHGAVEQQRREHGGLRFCFQANLGDNAEALHSQILADFVRQHGSMPLCNSGAR